MQELRDKPCYIIAEAGVNHNGKVDLARELVYKAKESGADAVKFQTFNTNKLLSKNAPKAGYQLKNTNPVESQERMLKKLELDFGDFIQLKELCDKIKIDFISTPFDQLSAKLLVNTQLVDVFKIASSEIINLELLDYIASYNYPMILSTGMCNLQDIEQAITIISSRSKVTLLQCVSNYPADPSNTNLKAMLTMREAFKTAVGYSDHTEGIIVPIAAVALGAEVIEKHFTLDKGFVGPDHLASLNPKELKEMVSSIRIVESCLGDGIKRPTPEEEVTKLALRKSIVSSRKIRKGEKLIREMIEFKRPGTGIEPSMFTFLEGHTLKVTIEEDTILTHDMFK